MCFGAAVLYPMPYWSSMAPRYFTVRAASSTNTSVVVVAPSCLHRVPSASCRNGALRPAFFMSSTASVLMASTSTNATPFPAYSSSSAATVGRYFLLSGQLTLVTTTTAAFFPFIAADSLNAEPSMAVADRSGASRPTPAWAAGWGRGTSTVSAAARPARRTAAARGPAERVGMADGSGRGRGGDGGTRWAGGYYTGREG